jgi:acetyl-CoA carboxylase biotin carboxylase subunit
MFKKVLVANRGEIATRVMRTCREMGIRTVAVYSEADRWSNFVSKADESYWLGGSHPQESYLNMGRVLEVAKACKAEAIHPGYGFLSENAEFAEACRKEKIAFVGPKPEAIRAVGNKLSGRALAQKLGVPTVPGHDGAVTPDQARAFGKKHGYPILLKAAGGGGGRGMRVVRSEPELEKALREATQEATTFFKDSTIFIERYVEEPRHIEVQIIADKKGTVLHLNERECSVQRRHQKLIEESPSAAIDAELRRRITDSAVKVMSAAGYDNAGTVEFLLDKNKNFYFLEVNSRLQVEHPVTEMVTSLDLVKLQLLSAAGLALPLRQADVAARGHAIECRIQAEDPEAGFSPSLGEILTYRLPGGPFVRVDSDLRAHQKVTVHYDSLLAKLITWGPSREEAIDRMLRSLQEFTVVGLKTTIPFHRKMLSTKEFREGKLHTGLVEKVYRPESASPEARQAAIVAAAMEFLFRERQAPRTWSPRPLSPWKTSYLNDQEQ